MEQLGITITCNYDIIDEYGFMDLRFIGSQFTWSKHFEDGHSIWGRLDKGLANSSWFLKFPSSRVHHLNCSFLDHLPFLINLSGLNQVPRKKKCGWMTIDVPRLLKLLGIQDCINLVMMLF